jgi:hypothetical protein
VSKAEYFDEVRDEALTVWSVFENPHAWGSIKAIFKQVKSPGHVLSELLQNADDAGATEVSVRIEGSLFSFEHNGEDFKKEHFASLCHFNRSNKSTLDTIGFRGMGFKSTFSVGDKVMLTTPSLSVDFHEDKFIVPIWQEGRPLRDDGKTVIEIEIADEKKQEELERSLEKWSENPLALIFFRHIRVLQILNQEFCFDTEKMKEVCRGEKKTLCGEKDADYFLIRSDKEVLPDEVLEEVKEERGCPDDTNFQPCTVDIILGIENGELYVVLPTGVKTDLPFACNAPFIQTPDRHGIKPLSASETNRWFLERVGKLAASAMWEWLNNTDLTLEERAKAYDLFPDVNRDDTSPEGMCGKIVEEAFKKEIDEKNILLTEDDKLVGTKQAMSVPSIVLDVWSAMKSGILFDEAKRPPLCRYISAKNKKKLKSWGQVEEEKEDYLLDILRKQSIPKPDSWEKLFILWEYIEEKRGQRYNPDYGTLRIVPVQGKSDLFAVNDVIRIGKTGKVKELRESVDDWKFLEQYLTYMDQSWISFLEEKSKGEENEREDSDLKKVRDLLEKVKLSQPTPVDKVINHAARMFFKMEEMLLADAVRIAQIAARFNVRVEDGFQYVTKDKKRRQSEIRSFGDKSGIECWYYCSSRRIYSRYKKYIVFDKDDALANLLSVPDGESHVLHPDYSSGFRSCSQEQWDTWVSSDKAGILDFIPLMRCTDRMRTKPEVEEMAKKHDYTENLSYHRFKAETFSFESWDFHDDCWKHWDELAHDDPSIWVKVLKGIFRQGEIYKQDIYKQDILETKLYHLSPRSENKKEMTYASLTPSWVVKMRERRCLLNRKGDPQKPKDLHRLTPETQGLSHDQFVEGDLDCEANHKILNLLGVNTKPFDSDDPENLLERLRSLSEESGVSNDDVDSLYRALSTMTASNNESEFAPIKERFASEKLILIQDGTWQKALSVHLPPLSVHLPPSDSSDREGFLFIRSSVRDLPLWKKLGIKEPSVESEIDWLKTLPLGEKLPSESVKCAKSIMKKESARVWNECQCWFNVKGGLVSADSFAYGLSMQSLVGYDHLFDEEKEKVADLRDLSSDIVSESPFSALPSLKDCIVEHIAEDCSQRDVIGGGEWLRVFGTILSRIKRKNEEETDKIRKLALSLSQIKIVEADDLRVEPYIDGNKVGDSRDDDAFWEEDYLYIKEMSSAKRAMVLPTEIARFFSDKDIESALHFSVDRPQDTIKLYLEEKFALEPETEEEIFEEGKIRIERHPIDPRVEYEVEEESDRGVSQGMGLETPSGKNSFNDESMIRQKEKGALWEGVKKKENLPLRSERLKTESEIKTCSNSKDIPPPSRDRRKRTYTDNERNQEVADRAMRIVIEKERKLGYQPENVSDERGLGYDIRSTKGDETRYIEVKGISSETMPITLSANEILCSHKYPDKFILAIVLVGEDAVLRYIYGKVDCNVEALDNDDIVSVSYSLKKLRERAE